MNKGGQNLPTMYESIPAVAELNRVPGFEPLKLLRKVVSPENGEEAFRLDLSYKKLWFRLANPQGRIRLSPLRVTEQIAIFEAQVYLDRSDAEPIGSFTSGCTREDAPGGQYIQAAQLEAMDEALTDAGFGLQFADLLANSDGKRVALDNAMPRGRQADGKISSAVSVQESAPQGTASLQEPEAQDAALTQNSVMQNTVPAQGMAGQKSPAAQNMMSGQKSAAQGGTMPAQNVATAQKPSTVQGTVSAQKPIMQGNVLPQNAAAAQKLSTVQGTVPAQKPVMQGAVSAQSMVAAQKASTVQSAAPAREPVMQGTVSAQNTAVQKPSTAQGTVSVSAQKPTMQNTTPVQRPVAQNVAAPAQSPPQNGTPARQAVVVQGQGRQMVGTAKAFNPAKVQGHASQPAASVNVARPTVPTQDGNRLPVNGAAPAQPMAQQGKGLPQTQAGRASQQAPAVKGLPVQPGPVRNHPARNASGMLGNQPENVAKKEPLPVSAASSLPVQQGDAGNAVGAVESLPVQPEEATVSRPVNAVEASSLPVQPEAGGNAKGMADTLPVQPVASAAGGLASDAGTGSFPAQPGAAETATEIADSLPVQPETSAAVSQAVESAGSDVLPIQPGSSDDSVKARQPVNAERVHSFPVQQGTVGAAVTADTASNAGKGKVDGGLKNSVQEAMALLGGNESPAGGSAPAGTSGSAPVVAELPGQAQPIPGSKAQPEATPRYTADMPVEEILKLMTFDEARGVVVDAGVCKGQTLAEVAERRPPSLKFYFYGGYRGDNNILRAAAKIMLDYLEAQKAA